MRNLWVNIPFIFVLMRMLIAFLGLSFIIPYKLEGQTIADSLKTQMHSPVDSIRLKALIQLSKAYATRNLDSALYFGRKAILLGTEMEDPKNLAWALNYLGSSYYYHGDYDSAKYYHLKALTIRIEIGDKKGLGASYNNLGNIYDDEGNSSLALDYYQKAQNYFEDIDFRPGMAITYNSIGNLHYFQKNYRLALSYFDKALALHIKNADTMGIIHSMNNKAIMHDELMEKDKAMECYLYSLKLAEKMDFTDAIMVCCANLGQLFLYKNDFQKAEEYLRRTIAINKIYGDSTQFITVYSNFATLYRKRGNLDSALYYSQLSLPIALRNGLKASAAFNYNFIAEIYALKKNFKVAYEYHHQYLLLNDSILNEESSRILNEMETKYETEKKDKELLAQNSKLARTDAANAKNTLQRNALIAGSALLVIFALFIVVDLRKKRTAHKAITLQKQIIEEKQRDILDSIHYAKRIQHSLLPTQAYINRTLKRLQS